MNVGQNVWFFDCENCYTHITLQFFDVLLFLIEIPFSFWVSDCIMSGSFYPAVWGVRHFHDRVVSFLIAVDSEQIISLLYT